ncbi:MAG TPA: hypothetical protein DCY33_00405 [Gemmatimonadetes bacterium]|nr:hypothetical protein [Gemmatimonadaceae bacterium]HAY76268.1 hypothetical protein [Gemmatimonadota bacterium]
MTARLATHPDIAGLTRRVLRQLHYVGMDVDFVGEFDAEDPFASLRAHEIDMALVGLSGIASIVRGEFTAVAVLPRMETRDVLVSLEARAKPLLELPPGTTIGVTGLRRRALLAAHRPDLVPLQLGADFVRGTIEREVEVEDSLASAGIEVPEMLIMSALDAKEIGLLDEAVEALDPKSWFPEPGQGALALLARHPIAEATALDHLPTRTALRTELALIDAMAQHGTDTLGCLAQPSGRWIRLWAGAVSVAGDRMIRSNRTGPLDEPEGLGVAVADELLARGYERLTSAGQS